MNLVILGAGAIALWCWKQGHLRALRWGDVAAVIGVLAGLNALRKGQAPIGMAALGGGALWLWLRTRRAPAPAISPEEALAILDLSPGADAGMIRAAHRRLIARVHPDAGGSEQLARRVNGARDVLLDRLNRNRDRTSSRREPGDA